jgi:hypothetical protein
MPAAPVMRPEHPQHAHPHEQGRAGDQGPVAQEQSRRLEAWNMDAPPIGVRHL